MRIICVKASEKLKTAYKCKYCYYWKNIPYVTHVNLLDSFHLEKWVMPLKCNSKSDFK